jgi:hypothetical protein
MNQFVPAYTNKIAAIVVKLPEKYDLFWPTVDGRVFIIQQSWLSS